MCVVLLSVFAVRIAMMAAMPVFDPSEARYAAISANMARTGDFLTPMFTYMGTYQPFKGKPPLVFQGGGMFCRMIGVCEFAVRLTPFLSFVFFLFILYRSVKQLEGVASAWLATGICATSVAMYAAAGMCMTDVPLTCCAVGALLMYARSRGDPRFRDAAAIGLLLGCGMLVKGPVAVALFVIPVVADAAINRSWRLVFKAVWLWSLPVFLLVAAPWFILMQREHHDFLRYFFLNENLLRFLLRDYGDRYGAGRETFRGMAAVWAFVVALPWAVLPAVDVLKRRRGLFDRRNFFFVSMLSIAAFWCLTSRVPLAYLLPVVPLFAAWLASSRSARPRLWKMLPFAAVAASGTTCAVLLYTWFLTDRMPGSDAPRRISKRCFSHEFYHGPWGEGAPR